MPAESVTVCAAVVAPARTPTKIASRLPAVMLAVGVTVMVLAEVDRLEFCWMKAGAYGVTAADMAEGALEPLAFTAITVKVYGVPFVRPMTVAAVAVPATVVTA